ncbi:calcium-binding protein [Rhizobium sp. KVB221]|uniref:Calcium-binding protein n=1 Tax=Rhizobium setariae TaxID=2801340 RepID=A0A936YRV7_9HYPH|nr:calcium-binding protein [Rhizobium setariae]MBL0374553.1 calcium-binding protein [Rhizobium setariae]
MSFGIYVVGDKNTINIGAKSSITAGAGVYAAEANGVKVSNRGDIASTNVGIAVGERGTVVNSGEIMSFAGVGAGADSTVTNMAGGRIIGGAGGAVSFAGVGSNRLVNDGFIAAAGGLIAIRDDVGRSTIINTGTIEGAVLLGAGNDFFDTSKGVFRGIAAGGTGDDTYVTSGKLTVIEADAEGTDTVRSSASFTLAANVEALILNGEANINGTGSADNNVITGNAGNNVLKGMKGDDHLRGGNGTDTLVGGAGADILSGQGGTDTFVFTKVSDSSAVVSDMISDFSHQQHDTIDLAAIDANELVSGNQAFKFIGGAEFHGKLGELRFEKQVGVTIVQGDTDGDGDADLVIALQGNHQLTKFDFEL